MPSGLKRDLGLLGVFSIATGCMISSGLFVLPGIAFMAAGPAVILSYALASILVIPSLLSKAELATAMPKAGGSYVYLRAAFGPLPAFLFGWTLLLIIATGATAAVAMTLA